LRFGGSVPSLTKARFRIALSLADESPETPIFLCFGADAGRLKAAPRLKRKTIPKGGQKGKKNAGKTGVFLLENKAFFLVFLSLKARPCVGASG
jgi:hypothetical protein